MVWGFSRFVLFLFLGLLRAPTRNSPERVRDTIWTFPQKTGKHPGLETPRFSFSQSSVPPLFGGTKSPKALVLLCFGAIKEGRMICDRSLLTCCHQVVRSEKTAYCRAEKKYERKVFSGGINSFLKIRIRIRQVFLAFNRKNTNSIRPEFFSFQDTNTNPKNTKRIPGRILFVFFPCLTVTSLKLRRLDILEDCPVFPKYR